MGTDLAERIVKTLTSDESRLRREAVDLIASHLLDKRIDEWMDARALSAALVRALASPPAERIVAEHLNPAWNRQRARCEAADETVSAFLPDDVRADLRSVARSVTTPEARWARGALDSETVRELVQPVLQETLVNFARRLPVLGEGAMAGLAGRWGKQVKRQAEKLAQVGKSMAPGIGAEMDRRVQGVAAEFSRAAVGELRDNFQRRLASEEGRALTTKLRLELFDAAMGAPLSELMDDLDAVGRERWVAAAPATVRHNLSREPWRAAVAQEITAFLAVEGTKTVRELLLETQTLETVERALEEQGDRLARELFESEDFGRWLRELLAL